MGTLYKTRLVCFRLLTVILYGQFPWLVRSGPARSVRISPFGRHCQLDHGRTKDNLNWLFTFGYITEPDYSRKGWATFDVNAPIGMDTNA